MFYPSYLIHFNRNHDIKGRFTIGDGDGDGVSDDHSHRKKGDYAGSPGHESSSDSSSSSGGGSGGSTSGGTSLDDVFAEIDKERKEAAANMGRSKFASAKKSKKKKKKKKTGTRSKKKKEKVIANKIGAAKNFISDISKEENGDGSTRDVDVDELIKKYDPETAINWFQRLIGK